MTHSKKHISSWRCGAFDICLGFLIIFYPLILLNSFLSAFLFLFFLSTISSLNTISMVKKIPSLSVLMQLSSYDERVTDKLNSRKTEKKEFSLLKCVIMFLCTVLTFHLTCILFGAPIFELYTSTLYFSCSLTALTVYPLLWFFYSCDSLLTILRIFSDANYFLRFSFLWMQMITIAISFRSATLNLFFLWSANISLTCKKSDTSQQKYDNYVESHFYCFVVYSIIGAWVGAFPIPLDWDRPWQEWPITCCIGASLGYAAAHFFVGAKLLYSHLKEKKKLMRSV